MKLTCSQMEILISFYVSGDLSQSLKTQVEEHLANCNVCKRKYEIMSSVIADFKQNCQNELSTPSSSEVYDTNIHANSYKYVFFKNNLSAYIDNELSDEQNLKIKKFAINNRQARKELENNFNIKKMLHKSFEKIKEDNKNDFSNKILKQLNLKPEYFEILRPSLKNIIILLGLIVITAAIHYLLNIT